MNNMIKRGVIVGLIILMIAVIPSTANATSLPVISVLLMIAEIISRAPSDWFRLWQECMETVTEEMELPVDFEWLLEQCPPPEFY
jgi:hypothetical protein